MTYGYGRKQFTVGGRRREEEQKMTEKKYLYALNEMAFAYDCYSWSVWALKLAYPRLKVGDVISRAEVHKPKLVDFISAFSLEGFVNENHEDETGCRTPLICVPRDSREDVEKRIAEVLEPFSYVAGVYWKAPEDYVLTEKDLDENA